MGCIMQGESVDFILHEISSVLGIPVIDIDLRSSFAHLGGHSLSAISLVSACQEHRIQLVRSTESSYKPNSLQALKTRQWIILSVGCWDRELVEAQSETLTGVYHTNPPSGENFAATTLHNAY